MDADGWCSEITWDERLHFRPSQPGPNRIWDAMGRHGMEYGPLDHSEQLCHYIGRTLKARVLDSMKSACETYTIHVIHRDSTLYNRNMSHLLN